MSEDHADTPAAIQKLDGAHSTLINKEDQIKEGIRILSYPNIRAPVVCKILNCTTNTDALKRFAETQGAQTIPKNTHGETLVYWFIGRFRRD